MRPSMEKKHGKEASDAQRTNAKKTREEECPVVHHAERQDGGGKEKRQAAWLKKANIQKLGRVQGRGKLPTEPKKSRKGVAEN